MINDFQGEKYNPDIDKMYNNNSLKPTWKKKISLSSMNNDIYYSNNVKISLNPKLPYIFTNIGSQIMNPFFNSYKKEYNNNPNYYNYISTNNKNRKLTMDLPLIVNKPKKIKIKNYTPTLTRTNFSIIKDIKKNISNLVVSNVIQETINTPPRINTPKKKSKKSSSKNNKIKILNYEKLIKKNKTEDNLEQSIKPFLTTEMKLNSYKKWWNLLRFFAEIYYFFSVLRKYTKKIKIIRYKEINKIEENLIEDIHKIRNWILELQGEFWNDLIKCKNINISFDENDLTDKIKRNSKILIQLIKSYLYNLSIKTNDIEQVPKEIQNIIYKYIKRNAYFPRKYLNLFLIKRLNFNYYGSCSNNYLEQNGMNLCYLLVSCISVQQIFLNIKFIFKKLKPYENISIIGIYIASILYYIQKEAFSNKIKENNNFINLFNYYRAYQLKNIEIEKEKDITKLVGINKAINIAKINNDNTDINNDIYNKLLINYNRISKFWEINFKKMKKLSDSLYIWSCNLAKLIMNKYEKF